ncbi:MAG: hypothetical protein PHH11_14135, partial [Methylomonas sp.]|nr:hypothetical protein [Methylomonas sp.]
MNKTRKILISLVGGISLLIAGIAPATAELTGVVKIAQGDNISVVNGGVLTVDVIGQDFTVAPDGAAFSLSWDPSVLSYVSSTVANPPWNASYISEAQVSSGLIDYAFMGITTNGVNAGANFGLASFTFNVLGHPGDVTALALGNDSYDIGFINGETGLNVNYVNSQVQVVPLPAAVWMFGVGFVGMMGGMKR